MSPPGATGAPDESFMFAYAFQRLLVLAATLIFASLAVFGVLEILPGNAAQTMLGASATPEAVAALAHKLGLDQPIGDALLVLDRRRACAAISGFPTPTIRRSAR